MKHIESLLSGSTTEKLGVIKFSPSPSTSSDVKCINTLNGTTVMSNAAKKILPPKIPKSIQCYWDIKKLQSHITSGPYH